MTAASGLLLLLSDVETLVPSRLFWIKMSAFALLVANGLLVMHAERHARSTDGESGWPRLAIASAISAALWLTIVFLGEWLRVGA